MPFWANALMNFVVDQRIPTEILNFMLEIGIDSLWQFLIVMNIFLLILGMIVFLCSDGDTTRTASNNPNASAPATTGSAPSPAPGSQNRGGAVEHPEVTPSW